MNVFMQAAFEQAQKGYVEGGVPIGSVVVFDNQIIGRGHNRRIQQGSAILHAEMDALENAGRQSAHVYRQCTLYTTLSPCPMCSGAIELYGIRHVIIGENQNFMGAEEHLRHLGVRLDVLQNNDCIALMARFIRERADIWHEDIGHS